MHEIDWPQFIFCHGMVANNDDILSYVVARIHGVCGEPFHLSNVSFSTCTEAVLLKSFHVMIIL
jgi:hypothetical protein